MCGSRASGTIPTRCVDAPTETEIETMADGDLTSEGTRLVQAWLAAQDRLRRANSEVVTAECDVSNSQSALAKWMLPEDAKPGEKICVWHGDSLIEVEVPLRTNEQARVTVRKRGRSIDRR